MLEIWIHPARRTLRHCLIPAQMLSRFLNCGAVHLEQPERAPDGRVRLSRPDAVPILPRRASGKHRSGIQETMRMPATTMEKTVARALHDKSRANGKTPDIRGVFEQTLCSGHEPACFGRSGDD